MLLCTSQAFKSCRARECLQLAASKDTSKQGSILLERLEPLDELAPERLERRVPLEAREAAVVEGDAEVLEERERPAVEGAGLVLEPEELAEEVFRDLDAQRGGVDVGCILASSKTWRASVWTY